jgi:nitronate monooxygenase
MLTTRFTELVGCRLPLQLAGLGQLGAPRLAAAVAEAGGLGMLGWGGAPPDYVRNSIAQVRRSTKGVFGMNFIVAQVGDPAAGTVDPGFFEALTAAASGCRVVEFFYGNPARPFVEHAHRGGALVSWQVGSRDEAIQAERSGCDFVVAQGIEAGGHVRGTTRLAPLLAEVLSAVRVPVVAAGGIGTGRAVMEALQAGASGVRVGTRFVAAAESDAHPRYVERLIQAEATDTVLTEAFSTNWPRAPHRVLRWCVDDMKAYPDDIVAERPYPWAPAKLWPVRRGESVIPTKSTVGYVDAMSLFAGESVAAVRRVQSAADIVRELTLEAERWQEEQGSAARAKDRATTA